MLYSIVAVLVLVVDQAVKFYTVRNIPPQAIGDACKELIPGVIHMTNVQNYGAAFSILENSRWILVAVSALFIVGIIALISMDIIHTRFGRWTAVLVMAGALGNCIDRVLLGYVVDMFEFELFTFAVFNVADIFITVCGILFCVHVIVYREPEEERNAVPRPEKKRSKLFASRPESGEEDIDGADEDVPAPRRPARAAKAAARKAVRDAAVPRRDRSAHRTLEEELRPLDPDDPFAEWDDSSAARSGRAAQPAEGEAPAPRKARRAQAPAADTAARPARRRTAPTVEDGEDDHEPDMPAPRKPARPEKAAAAPVQEPVGPVQEPDGAGFDEYSLEDILAEFRDS